jgi:hypothetical protein
VASLKDIAVPSNPSARRSKRIAASTVAEDPATAEISPIGQMRRTAIRAAVAAPMHRYHLGERLRMGNGGYSIARAASFCKVTALLPYEGKGSLLYRVRSETEQFERVVAEADLSRNVDGS